VSEEVIDLIKNLLVVDPKQRLSAGDALNHKWFKKHVEATMNGDKAINPEVIKRLQSFKGVSKLKKAAMNMLVKMAD